MTARLHHVSVLALGRLCALASLRVAAAMVCVPLPALSAAVPAAVPAAQPATTQEAVRDGPEALAAVQRLLAAGAPALALMRIERSQAPGPRWAEWETLRLGVLAELGSWQQVALRTEALSAYSPLPGPFLRSAWLAGAEATLRAPASPASPASPVEAAAAGVRVRALAARAVWLSAPATDELRRAQAVVIESLFTGGDAPAGYRSMLRFRQDMPAPGTPVIARFVALVAAHGVASDAVPMLPLLPEGHLVRIAVQAQLGLVAPPAAAVQARMAMRSTTPAASLRDWQALRTAALAIGDTLLVVEATERLLDADPSDAGAATTARALWRDYFAAAPAVANREQLLVGDAFGWSDAAARLAARDPATARTLFAFLSIHAADVAVRETARLQFASLLREAGLGRAAVRLFLDRESVDPMSLGIDLRRLLADAAAARRMWVQAADLRRSLTLRPGEDVGAWRMADAELQAKAGRFDDAVASARAALAPQVRADVQVRAHALADLLADAGDAGAAARIREAAGPLPVPPRRP